MGRLKPGDEVIYYKYDFRKSGRAMSRTPTKYRARVKKLGKARVTIELDNGRTYSVSEENLELVQTPPATL